MSRSIVAFAVRRALAALATVVALCALWTGVYAAVLFWAMVAGGGLGGPLVYPAGLVFTLFAGIVSTVVFLLPSAGIAEYFARSRSWPTLSRIPLCCLILASLCLTAGFLLAWKNHEPSLQGLQSGALLFVLNLIPMCIYWWTAQSGPLLVSLWRRLARFTPPA